MSNEKSLIEKLKVVLGMVEEATEVKLAQAKLEDGTVVEFEGDELMVGSIVYVIPAEGKKILAPVKEHTLENGNKIVVDEEGKVTQIFEKEEETDLADSAEPVEPVQAALTPEEQTAIVSELMQILEPRIAALEEAILLSSETYKKENEELKSQVQKLSEQPGGAPVKAPIQLPEADNALARIVKNKQK